MNFDNFVKCCNVWFIFKWLKGHRPQVLSDLLVPLRSGGLVCCGASSSNCKVPFCKTSSELNHDGSCFTVICFKLIFGLFYVWHFILLGFILSCFKLLKGDILCKLTEAINVTVFCFYSYVTLFSHATKRRQINKVFLLLNNFSAIAASSKFPHLLISGLWLCLSPSVCLSVICFPLQCNFRSSYSSFPILVYPETQQTHICIVSLNHVHVLFLPF